MSRDKILEVARGELHVREDDGNNRDRAGRIAEYWQAARHSRVENWLGYVPGPDHRNDWCAAFASWVYREAGYEMSHRYGSGFPGCNGIINWLEERDAYYEYREIDPMPGDLLFFDWQRLPRQVKDTVRITARRAAQVVDHVGLVEAPIQDDGGNLIGVECIEGNWSGGVSRTRRMLSSGAILGWGQLLV